MGIEYIQANEYCKCHRTHRTKTEDRDFQNRSISFSFYTNIYIKGMNCHSQVNRRALISLWAMICAIVFGRARLRASLY